MKYLKLFVLSFFLVACGGEQLEAPDCNNGLDFLLGMLANQGDKPEFELRIAEGFDIHSYSFRSALSGKICSIGYQSVSGETYGIQISDSEGLPLLYTEYAFSSDEQEYLLSQPVLINAGETYTISRIGLSDVGFDSGNVVTRENGVCFSV